MYLLFILYCEMYATAAASKKTKKRQCHPDSEESRKQLIFEAFARFELEPQNFFL